MNPDCRQSPGLNTIPSNTPGQIGFIQRSSYIRTVIAKDVCNITPPLPLLSKTS